MTNRRHSIEVRRLEIGNNGNVDCAIVKQTMNVTNGRYLQVRNTMGHYEKSEHSPT